MKPLYLANAKSSTPVSDDNMTTLTVPRYATAADITSALALYATSAQLPRSWLNTLSAINKHTLTVAQHIQISTEDHPRNCVDSVFVAMVADIKKVPVVVVALLLEDA